MNQPPRKPTPNELRYNDALQRVRQAEAEHANQPTEATAIWVLLFREQLARARDARDADAAGSVPQKRSAPSR